MPRILTIGSVVIDDASPAYCIAELGSNGQRDTELTKQFIKAAADAGASACKTQIRTNERLYTRAMLEQPYLGPNSFGSTYGAHRAALEYTRDQHEELRDYAWEHGVAYGSTPFDLWSVDVLSALQVDFIKIASACVTDTVLLDYAAQQGLPIILSTGTGTQHDVDLAVETVTRRGCPLAVLQCTAVYPLLDPALLNLRVIETYWQRYPFIVTGLSSHFPRIWDVETAYALGGRIFEKHFTLDRAMRGADHAFSLSPYDFEQMVANLAGIRTALGSPLKNRLPEEQAAIVKMGKVLRAARDLPAGHVLDRGSIAIKSPGWPGVPASRLAEYLGRTLPEAVAEDEPLPELGWYR